jgi:hypothetical protein
MATAQTTLVGVPGRGGTRWFVQCVSVSWGVCARGSGVDSFCSPICVMLFPFICFTLQRAPHRCTQTDSTYLHRLTSISYERHYFGSSAYLSQLVI